MDCINWGNYKFPVHHAMGLSYCGVSGASNRSHLFVRFVLMMWNMAVFGLSYYSFYISVVTTNTGSDSSDDFIEEKSMAPLVTYIRFSSLLVYFLFGYLLNLYLGFVMHAVARLVNEEILPFIDNESEYRIGFAVTLIQSIMIFLLCALFQLLLYAYYKHIFVIRWIENIFNLYSLSSPVAILAYLNFSLASIIRNASKVDSLPFYVDRLMQIRVVVERTTCLFGPAFIVLIINSSIVCISSLCLLVSDFRNTFFISIIGFIDYSILLIGLCLIAGYPEEVTKDTMRKFEQRLFLSSVNRTKSDQQNASELLTLAKIQQSIQMVPYGLFTLNRNFIMKFYSFVLSNSVILIQTSEGETMSCDKANQTKSR